MRHVWSPSFRPQLAHFSSYFDEQYGKIKLHSSYINGHRILNLLKFFSICLSTILFTCMRACIHVYAKLLRYIWVRLRACMSTNCHCIIDNHTMCHHDIDGKNIYELLTWYITVYPSPKVTVRGFFENKFTAFERYIHF